MATAFDTAWRHYQAGQLPQAEELCRQIVQADADHVEARHLLGLIAALTGRDDLALDHLHAAIRLKPDFADAHNVLGILMAGQHKPEEAVARFREAIRLRPDFGEAYNNLGSLLQQQGRLEEAEAVLRRGPAPQAGLRRDRLQPGYRAGEAGADRGGDRLQSVGPCRLKPDHADAHANLAHGLMERGQLDEAIAEYRVALRLKPDAAQVHSNLVRLLHYHPGYDQPAIAGGMPALERAARRTAPRGNPAARPIIPDPDRRLRIGYVSSEFRDHVDSFFTVPLLSNHDRGAVRNLLLCRGGPPRRPDRSAARLCRRLARHRGALRPAGRRPGASRPDRHPRRPEAAHGRQPAPGLRPQAGAGAGLLAGISRDDRAVDHRLSPDRSLPRSAGAVRRLLLRGIRAPAGHLLVLRPVDRPAAGQCAAGPGIRRDHLRLPE